MDTNNFKDEEVILVMLQVAQNKRPLTALESKYWSNNVNLSDQITKLIRTNLENDGCIASHPVPIDSNEPSVKILPMLSYQDGGLTITGEDKLKRLIQSCEDKRLEKYRCIVNKSVKWIFRIISSLIVAFIVWKLGWR